MKDEPKKYTSSAKGSLAKYADTALWDKEDTAWEKEAEDKLLEIKNT